MGGYLRKIRRLSEQDEEMIKRESVEESFSCTLESLGFQTRRPGLLSLSFLNNTLLSIFVMTFALSSCVEPQGRPPVGEPCMPSKKPEIEERIPPPFQLALESFETFVKRNFPLGSSESRLVAWMDAEGFDIVQVGPADVAFGDEPDETERLLFRLRQGLTVNLRTLTKPGMIGKSYFSVGWNSDQCGSLVEVFADQELNKIDIP
jgi:hypothetical protein